MATNFCEFNFISEPSDKLKCLICLEVAKDPKQHDKCGKVFCSECIEKVKDKPCPVCKTQKPNYFTDTRAAQEIGDIPVKCKNSKNGCPWKGTVITLFDHVTSCECEIVSCKYSYVGCDVKKMKKDIKKHEEEDDKHHLHLALQSVAIPTLSHGESIVFKITDYSLKKRNNEVFTCDPFYTHTNGYKMCLKVFLNGTESGAGTHVSVATCLLQGPFDKYLKWPFTWTIMVEALNQFHDTGNMFHDFKHNVDQSGGQCFEEQFLSHKCISQYPTILNNDTMYFRVKITNQDYLPWLECGKQINRKLAKDCYRYANKEPLVLKVQNYQMLRESNKKYKYSFWSAPSGYNMRIIVFCNGYGNGKGSHVSVAFELCEGPYDKMLPWPFQGTVKIILLNQLANDYHHSIILKPTIADCMITGEFYYNAQYIRQDRLQGHGDQQFLMDNTLYFRFSVSTASMPKPWLVCTDS